MSKEADLKKRVKDLENTVEYLTKCQLDRMERDRDDMWEVINRTLAQVSKDKNKHTAMFAAVFSILEEEFNAKIDVEPVYDA